MLKLHFACRKKKMNKNRYDKIDVKKYLDGFVWCLYMYKNGLCHDIEYEYNLNAPSAYEIYYYYNFDDGEETNINMSELEPVNYKIYPLLVLPEKAIEIMPETLQQHVNKLDKLHTIENCETCNNIKDNNSKTSKLLYKQRQNNEDITETRKKLSEIAKQRKEHKLEHQNDKISVKEMVKLLSSIDMDT